MNVYDDHSITDNARFRTGEIGRMQFLGERNFAFTLLRHQLPQLFRIDHRNFPCRYAVCFLSRVVFLKDLSDDECDDLTKLPQLPVAGEKKLGPKQDKTDNKSKVDDNVYACRPRLAPSAEICRTRSPLAEVF